MQIVIDAISAYNLVYRANDKLESKGARVYHYYYETIKVSFAIGFLSFI